MDRHAQLIDAVEVNAMCTRLVDFNLRAITWARARGKPLVGNSDLHVLNGLGITYSVVHPEPTADAICDAIRHGRVEAGTTALEICRTGHESIVLAVADVVMPGCRVWSSCGVRT
jgi:hypothetical protein